MVIIHSWELSGVRIKLVVILSEQFRKRRKKIRYEAAASGGLISDEKLTQQLEDIDHQSKNTSST